MITQNVRTKSGRVIEVNATKAQQIKMFCCECMGWEANPKECEDKLCPLYPSRGRINLTYDKLIENEKEDMND